MNSHHSIQFSNNALEQALAGYVHENGLRVHGFLSRKQEGVVVLASLPECATPDHKWIVRISLYNPKVVHNPYQFGKAWHNKNCPYLPRMNEPIYHKSGRKYFVIEQYEWVGEMPDDTDVDCNAEYPATSFTDLFQHVVANGAHKSLPILYSALCGLAVLHDADFYHLDFSLENIACGFGHRGVLIDFEASSHIINYFVPQRDVTKSFKTTYAAPEITKKSGDFVDPAAVDVWAFGVALFLTITREYAFNARDGSCGKIDQQILFGYVCRHGFMAYLRRYKPETVVKIQSYAHLDDLLERIFIVYPKSRSDSREILFCSEDGRERLSAAEIRDHPFWRPYVGEGKTREDSAAKPVLVSELVKEDADCQIAPENFDRTGSWWTQEV